ncbi:hypothetical protein EJB05_12162, partial [Eragrostis curvula]
MGQSVKIHLHFYSFGGDVPEKKPTNCEAHQVPRRPLSHTPPPGNCSSKHIGVCQTAGRGQHLLPATPATRDEPIDAAPQALRDTNCTDEEKKRARDYLWCHLGEDFQNMYIVEPDPAFIWDSLDVHFEKMKEAELPEATYNWEHLRFEDFDSVIEYNSALQRVSAQLKVCGRDVTEASLIEKTLSTFPSSKRVLVDIYLKQNHHTYLELVSQLLVAQKQDEAVMRNYNARPAQAA